MDTWPKVKEDDGVAFRDFSDFLTQCQAALTELPSLRIFEDTHYIRFMCEKLPKALQRRWGRIADNILKSNSRQPNFKEFVEFVDTESSVCNNTAFGNAKEVKKCSTFFNSLSGQQPFLEREDPINVQNSPKQTEEALDMHQGNRSGGRLDQSSPKKSKNVKVKQTCPFCYGRHYADKCTIPALMSKTEQNKLFSDHNLCTTCCRSHSLDTCNTKPFCGICKEKHFTFDHVNVCFQQGDQLTSSNKDQNKSNADQTSSFQNINGDITSNVKTTNMAISTEIEKVEDAHLARIMPVKVASIHNPNNYLITLAFLDEGSDRSFIEERIIDQLGPVKNETLIESSSLHHQDSIRSFTVSGLKICSISSDDWIDLPVMLTHKSIRLSRSSIPTKEMIKNIPSLQHIANVFPEKDLIESCSVGLLIARDVPEGLKPISCTAGIPYAIESKLGWGVIGCNTTVSNEANCSKASVFLSATFTKEVLYHSESLKDPKENYCFDPLGGKLCPKAFGLFSAPSIKEDSSCSKFFNEKKEDNCVDPVSSRSINLTCASVKTKSRWVEIVNFLSLLLVPTLLLLSFSFSFHRNFVVQVLLRR